MSELQKLLLIAVGSALVNNVVLSQFPGTLPLPWRIKEDGDSRGNGSGGYLRDHAVFFYNQSDLSVYSGACGSGRSSSDSFLFW